MLRVLNSSDVELVKLMVVGKGLNLVDALTLHYAIQKCPQEIINALLELGAADINFPTRPIATTPLHLAVEMMCSDMVAVVLVHHADPNMRTVDGVTPLDILCTLTSDFFSKGVVPGLTHIEPDKLRLFLELVQSAMLVLSREGAAAVARNINADAAMYPSMNTDQCNSNDNNGGNRSMASLSLDSRMVYLNLGGYMYHGSGGIGPSMYSPRDYQ